MVPRDDLLGFRPGSFNIRSCEHRLKDLYKTMRHARVIVYLHNRRFRNVP